MSSWAIALCAGSVGALVATGVIAATGGLRREVTIVRPDLSTNRGQQLSTQSGDDTVVLIAEQVRPSIAHLTVTTDSGTVHGSGVMFRPDGHLLTNWHLVDGSRSIRVVTASGKELPGRIVGSDRDTDIAIVKVEGGPYPVPRFGTASGLRVGERAIVLGSPLVRTPEASVSVGVVSGLHGELSVRDRDVRLLDLIETDAPISPGSSGGALLDGAGRVIGITTADPVEVRQLGFATPIDMARMVGDQLIATGRFVHVWLGIEGSDVEGGTAMQLGVDGGARVDKVLPDGPADDSGLLAHDVIVAIDGEPIVSMGALVVSLRGRPPGQAVVLDVIRALKWREIRVTLVERPPRP
jgi:S1-C subfamily serine protease